MTYCFDAFLANCPLSLMIDSKVDVEQQSFVSEIMDSSELWWAEVIFHSMPAELDWSNLFDEEVTDLPVDAGMDFSRHPEAAAADLLKH